MSEMETLRTTAHYFASILAQEDFASNCLDCYVFGTRLVKTRLKVFKRTLRNVISHIKF